MNIDLAVRRIGNSVFAKVPLEETMLLVFKDLVKEANVELSKLSPKDPDNMQKIAIVFESKAIEWKLICERFGPGYGLNPWGFRLMLRSLTPVAFHNLTLNGFTDIPNEYDPEFVPDSKKRHKSKS